MHRQPSRRIAPVGRHKSEALRFAEVLRSPPASDVQRSGLTVNNIPHAVGTRSELEIALLWSAFGLVLTILVCLLGFLAEVTEALSIAG